MFCKDIEEDNIVSKACGRGLLGLLELLVTEQAERVQYRLLEKTTKLQEEEKNHEVGSRVSTRAILAKLGEFGHVYILELKLFTVC